MADVARFDTKMFDQNRPKKFGFGKILLISFLVIFISSIAYGFLQYSNYKTFTSRGPRTEKGVFGNFEVRPGETVDSIAQRLVEEDFLGDQKVFTSPAYKWYLKLHPVDSNNIQVGIHQIPYNATPDEVFANLKAKGCNEVQVTLQEGWRLEEFAEELDHVFKTQAADSTKVTFSASEFETLAKNFTEDVSSLGLSFTPPTNLEGYLFPDTYRFCEDISTKDVINKLLQNFNSKVNVGLKTQLSSSKYSLDEVINIASMVEREGRQYETKRNVAGIIINRLELGMPLGIDATTQYEFGYSESQKSWWRKGDELDIVIDTEHTYNTRRNAGLPPTPIANPGIDSIKATLDPIINDNLYYITGNDNKMYYAKTQAEHDYNVCKYIYETCQ